MIEIILTKDGSHTLHHTTLNENYHSIHGAVQESKHVFIRQGLEFLLEQNPNELSILEIGFGTGLNALLTAQRVIKVPTKIYYTAIESNPLDESIWTNLNYASSTEDIVLFQKLHRVAWDSNQEIHSQFQMHKIHNALQRVELPHHSFNLIYFDAFAPDKQPEMWTLHVFEKIFNCMKSEAVLVTYSAKGQVKRDLKGAGLSVEAVQGPPGKREMIRAVKP